MGKQKQDGKFKTALVTAVKEEQKEQQEQKRLHAQYREENENVRIVEKTNMAKFLIRCIGVLVRTAATIALLVLAAAGFIALVYPQVRSELILVLVQVASEVKNMLQL